MLVNLLASIGTEGPIMANFGVMQGKVRWKELICFMVVKCYLGSAT
jgi:cytochrome c oxidase subunit IV